MRTALKVAGGLLLLVLVLVGAAYGWATSASNRSLARTFEAHEVDFPIPFPLTDAEIEDLGLDEAGAERVAMERAIERGRHLVESRYVCTECHGADFSGGVMVDAFPIGTLLGPNLTTGEGGRISGYGPVEWDHIVRHGILPDGRPAVMPSEDFERMSDQELSDVVAYVRSFAPVDNTVPEKRLGPLGRFLVATGEIRLSADIITSHTASHEVYPPATEVSVEFGRHLASICTGCHGSDLSGGPIAGGEPSWPPARNITPHPDALGAWDYDDFVVATREGVRPDGTVMLEPMSLLVPYLQRMSDVELEAIWTYLQSVPPVASEPS